MVLRAQRIREGFTSESSENKRISSVDHKILTAHREQVNNCFLLLLTSDKLTLCKAGPRRVAQILRRVKLPRLLWGLGG